jgi:hypothetical protein
MNSHDRLKARGITPTIDAERAFRLGYDQAQAEARASERRLSDRVARLERVLTEISLQAGRGLRK